MRPARRSPAGPGSCACTRRRRRRSGRRRGWASRRWSGATSCCARCIDLAARHGPGRGADDHDAGGRARARQERTWRRCWCSTSRCCRAMQTIFVRAKEVLGGVGEQTTRELLQRDAGAARRGARGSRPRAAGGGAGRGDERGGVGGRRGGDGVGAAGAPGAAFAGGGAGRVAVGGGARARRGAAPIVARQAAGAGRRGRALRRRDRAGRHRIRDAGGGGAVRSGCASSGGRRSAAAAPPGPAARRSTSRSRCRRSTTRGGDRAGAPAALPGRERSRRARSPAWPNARCGVPMLLVELVRGLKRDGLVRKSEKGQGWYLATDELERLPDLPLVQWLSSRETESLPPDLLAHARLASVLGVEFSSEEIEGVLQELERSGGGGRDPARRGHRRAAADRKRHPRAAPGRARRLPALAAARHRLPVGSAGPARGDPPRRVRLLPAARSAARDGAAAADGVSRRAQRAQGGGGEACTWISRGARRRGTPTWTPSCCTRHALENFSDVERRRADRGGAGAGPDAVSPGPPRGRAQGLHGGDRAGAAGGQRRRRSSALLLDEGIVLDWVGDWPRSRVVSEEAVALVAAHEELRTPLVHARLLMAQARSLMRAEKVPEALEMLRVAVKAAEPLGDEGYEPYTQSLLMVGYARRHPEPVRRGRGRAGPVPGGVRGARRHGRASAACCRTAR